MPAFCNSVLFAGDTFSIRSWHGTENKICRLTLFQCSGLVNLFLPISPICYTGDIDIHLNKWVKGLIFEKTPVMVSTLGWQCSILTNFYSLALSRNLLKIFVSILPPRL